jgi:Mg2+ and Co2+ transporter CorA
VVELKENNLMNDETQDIILKNIQQQVSEINIALKEFKTEINSKVSKLNDDVVRLRTLDENRQIAIEKLYADMNGIQEKADKKHSDLEDQIKNNTNTINTIDKKIARYMGIACGAFAVIEVCIQFLLKLIK